MIEQSQLELVLRIIEFSRKLRRPLRNFEVFYFTQTRGRSFDEGCEILNCSKGFLPMDDLKLKSVDEQT